MRLASVKSKTDYFNIDLSFPAAPQKAWYCYKPLLLIAWITIIACWRAKTDLYFVIHHTVGVICDAQKHQAHVNYTLQKRPKHPTPDKGVSAWYVSAWIASQLCYFYMFLDQRGLLGHHDHLDETSGSVGDVLCWIIVHSLDLRNTDINILVSLQRCLDIGRFSTSSFGLRLVCWQTYCSWVFGDKLVL